MEVKRAGIIFFARTGDNLTVEFDASLCSANHSIEQNARYTIHGSFTCA